VTHWGPNSQFGCLKGVPFRTTFCPIPVCMKPKGFKLRRQSMLLEKCSKRCNLITSQNSENGVPVWAGVQLTVIREGNFWTSELCRFGGTFGSVEAQCGHQRRPKEHFERVPKQSTVNRGTNRGRGTLPRYPPGGPPGGRGGQAFELY